MDDKTTHPEIDERRRKILAALTEPIKSRIISGLILALPITITISIIYWLFSTLQAFVLDPIAHLVELGIGAQSGSAAPGSMRGRIESGQMVTLAPVDPAAVRVDDVVLVAWKGGFLLHLVKEVKDGQLLSMVSMRDLMRVDLHAKAEELHYLHEYLYQVSPGAALPR